MSPVASFHAQLASIMEVLANTAVAEICELVDSGYAVLQLEISRSRKENEVLRRKLRLLELRTARGSGSTLRGSGAPRGPVARCQLPPQESARCRPPSPPSEPPQETPLAVETTAIVKVEDEDESWSQSDVDKGFSPEDDQRTETVHSSLLVKQEAGDGGAASWTSGEVSSTSTSSQNSLQGGGYDRVPFEPQIQHNPPGGGAAFPFPVGEAFHDGQGRALPTPEEQLPARTDGAGRGEPGGKAFVCSYCGKSLACFKNLKTHLRVHTGEKPFVCALCGKRFSDSSNLKRHQSVHTGEKRYGCVHCGKRFAQSGSLKVHMTVHTDYKQFRCSFCGKTFISGSHLRRHVALHSQDTQQGAAEEDSPPAFTARHQVDIQSA